MQREPMNGAVLEGGGPRDFRAAQELSHDHTGKFFLTLIKSLPQHVFFKGTNSVFISVNAAFAGDFGRKPEDFIGQSDLHLFPKELTEKYIARMR